MDRDRSIPGTLDTRTGIQARDFCLVLRTHMNPDAKALTRRRTEMSDGIFAAAAEKAMAIAPGRADHIHVEPARGELDTCAGADRADAVQML